MMRFNMTLIGKRRWWSTGTLALALACSWLAGARQAHAGETIRIAIGTQDTTINCATGGLIIRELKLLEKYLPHDGKYKDVTYDISWKNFTAGAPLTRLDPSGPSIGRPAADRLPRWFVLMSLLWVGVCPMPAQPGLACAAASASPGTVPRTLRAS